MHRLFLLMVVICLLTGCTLNATTNRLAQAGPVGTRPDPRTQGKRIDLRQTHGDVTVQVHWVYADAARVFVSYTLVSAAERRYRPQTEILHDATGIPFTFQSGQGVVGHSEVLNVHLPPGAESYFREFAGKIPAQATHLDLQLILHLEEVHSPVASVATASAGATVPSGDQPAVVPIRPGQRVGPFTFDFTVPIDRPN